MFDAGRSVFVIFYAMVRMNNEQLLETIYSNILSIVLLHIVLVIQTMNQGAIHAVSFALLRSILLVDLVIQFAVQNVLFVNQCAIVFVTNHWAILVNLHLRQCAILVILVNYLVLPQKHVVNHNVANQNFVNHNVIVNQVLKSHH